MGTIKAKHIDVGVELTRDEWAADSSHVLEASDSSYHDLVEVGSNGVTPQTTNTPSMVKARFGSAGVPANEIDLVSGKMLVASGATLESLGLHKGNAGRHATGALEFGHWPLSEQAGSAIADRTGHFPGAMNGTLAYTTSGLPANVPSALVLDGSSNYVNLGAPNLTDWNELSAALWLYVPSAAPDTTMYVFGNGIDSTAYGFCLAHITGNVLRAWAGTSGAYASATISRDTWFHVVVTVRKGKEVGLFVNGGALRQVSSLSSSLPLSGLASLILGTRAAAPNYYFKGSVAGARLYNRALKPGEIAALYNAGAGTVNPLEVASVEHDPHWRRLDSFTATAINTYSFTSSDPKIVAGAGLRIVQGNVTYYYVVTAVSGTTIQVAGPALNTGASALQSVEMCAPDRVVVERFPIPGSYASGRSAGDVLESRLWRRGRAALVALSAKHATNDTGAGQPYVNVKIGGNVVSTMNTNQGPSLSSAAWTPDLLTGNTNNVAINASNYGAVFGSVVDLALTVTGTNKDATGLAVDTIWVLK